MRQFLARDRALRGGALTARVIGLRRAELRACLHDRRAAFGNLGEVGARRTHRPRQLRRGRGQLDVRGRRIEVEQRLPGLHRLRIVGVDRGDLPRIARGDRDDVTRDIGVVGLFLGLGEQEVEHRPHDRGDHHHCGEDQQAGAACLGLALLWRGAGGLCAVVGRQHQRHALAGRIGGKVGLGAFGVEQPDVGVDQRQLAIEAAGDAHRIEAVGLRKAAYHLGGAGAFLRQRGDAGDRIRRLTHRADDALVIVGGGEIDACGGARQIRLQPAVVEDR
ncbi:hypothetical protein WR25_24279 [Diploscapter pachys]|uniref:Uncharacterized protein n=1 Tax=Diploscapter pachys TaxID=2018661 RepID=A0A2A2K656_9BILA|nr:hypothetical protein WR25_24279 [Diploscapter pachys]